MVVHLEKKGESLMIDGIEEGEVSFVGMGEKLFILILLSGGLCHQRVSTGKRQWNLPMTAA